MVTIPDAIYHRAKWLAEFMNRDVAEILADTIELSLSSFAAEAKPPKPVTELSDEEVLALTELQMDPAQDRRLSVLLDKQQAGELSEAERSELLALMQVYQESLLRKARALHEAVRRGLLEPLEP